MTTHGPPAAVFLDRDGTVIENRHYLDTVDGVVLLPGAGEALRRLADAGYTLVLVTNQSGVDRGYFPESILHGQHARLAELLAPYGVAFAAVRYCPHAPDAACACRKPRPGMIHHAATALGIDLARSWMIGDSAADSAAGRAAGCRAIRLGPPATDEPDAATPVLPDLTAAAAYVLSRRSHPQS